MLFAMVNSMPFGIITVVIIRPEPVAGLAVWATHAAKRFTRPAIFGLKMDH